MAFSLGSSGSSSLRTGRWVGAPRDRLRAVPCRAPKPSPGPPTSQAQAVVRRPRPGTGWMLPGRVTGLHGETLLLARAWAWENKSWVLGPCPFLSEQRITFALVEVYRDIVIWPWSDTEKFAITNHTPLLTFPIKGLCWKLPGSSGFLRHEPPISLHGPAINLSLLQTNVLLLFGLTVCRHTDLMFGNKTWCLLKKEKMIVFSPPHSFFDYKNVALFVLGVALTGLPTSISHKHPKLVNSLFANCFASREETKPELQLVWHQMSCFNWKTVGLNPLLNQGSWVQILIWGAAGFQSYLTRSVASEPAQNSFRHRSKPLNKIYNVRN